MLSKLLKFDLKSNAKILTILILAAFAMIPTFFVAGFIGNNILTSAVTFVGIFTSIAVFIGYATLQIIYFASTMTGRESYFTHTLPADTHQILFSKLFSALLWGTATVSVLLLCWQCYVNIFDIHIPGDVSGLIGKIVTICASQLLFHMNLIAFCISLSVHHRLAGFPRLIVSVAAYFIITNAVGVLMLMCIGITLFLQGELSSFLANEWSDVRAIEFIHQVFAFIAITYVLSAGAFYMLTARVFKCRKSI